MAFNPIMPSVVLIALHQYNNGNDDFFLFLSQILQGTTIISVFRTNSNVIFCSVICYPKLSPYATEC